MQYRNKSKLTSIEGIEVDEQSLWDWNVEKQLLVLVDEDQYATRQYVKSEFIPVYKPYNSQ